MLHCKIFCVFAYDRLRIAPVLWGMKERDEALEDSPAVHKG
jgi:hypothetical protein